MNYKAVCKCPKCSNLNEIIASDLRMIPLEDGKEKIAVLYIECKDQNCKEKLVVQIDNAESKGLLLLEKRQMKKAKESGNFKDTNHMMSIDKRLTDKRNELMKRYDGKTLYDGPKQFKFVCVSSKEVD